MPDTSDETYRTTKQSRSDRGSARFAKSDIEMSIPALFERRVRATPQRTAVGCGQKSLTYDALNRAGNRIAHAILRRRGEREEPVALVFRQGPNAVAATIGALKAGKIYVPLEPNQPVHGLQQIVAHFKPNLIISDGETETLSRRLADGAEHFLNIDTIAAEEAEFDPGLDLLPDRVCYIFYTSGTTGAPKGVFDSHRNVLHNIMRYTNNLGIGAEDRLSLIQSCGFSGTVSSLFSALLNGAAVCPFDLQRWGIDRLAGWVEREWITVFHSTPTIFEQLMATNGKFDSLRMIRLEGDRAEPRHISLFQSHFGTDCVLVNGLGLTEAGIVRQYFVTTRTCVDGQFVPVGLAIEDMDINLVDDEDCVVEPGGVGEIAIRSEYLACGYWQRPDLTKAAFVPDPGGGATRSFRTSDLGRMRADGCLVFLGRKDFQAKLHGQWVETTTIESALCAIEPISQSLVAVRDSASGAQQLVAYLVTQDARPPIENIRRVLGQTLPAVMIPSRYVFIDAMPLDRNGKIDRRGLPEPDRQRPVLEQRNVAAKSQEEKIVAECFGAILNIDRIGVRDDFFDLGGDSLLAAELLMMIEERLGRHCPMVPFSQSFSVVSIIGRLGQDLPENAVVPIQAGEDQAPLFCIHNYEGDVGEYFRLAACLGPDRPVYGLQSRAFTKGGSRDARVEDMAAAYLTEILATEPKGPYFLCGNCFGGSIAFEIAQQLRRQGSKVALLALIDTEFSGGFFHDLGNRILDPYHRRRFSNLPARHRPRHLAQRFQDFTRWALAGVGRRLTSAKISVLGGGHRPGIDRPSVIERNKLAHARYRPQVYDGGIVLICPGPPHNQRGWIGVAAGGCHVIEIALAGQPEESPHLTREPYVGKVAAHISGYLEIQAHAIEFP